MIIFSPHTAYKLSQKPEGRDVCGNAPHSNTSWSLVDAESGAEGQTRSAQQLPTFILSTYSCFCVCISQKFPNWKKTLCMSHQLNITMGRCQFTHTHLKPKSC